MDMEDILCDVCDGGYGDLDIMKKILIRMFSNGWWYRYGVDLRPLSA